LGVQFLGILVIPGWLLAREGSIMIKQLKKLKVGILGVTGYTGEELIKLLIRHPYVELKCLSVRSNPGKNIQDIYLYLAGKLDLVCNNYSAEEICEKCDFVFLALPHAASMDFVPELINKGLKVVDLSADYRFEDSGLYEKWYAVKHKDKENLSLAVYGLTELQRKFIKKANLVANPGCYPTAAILALAPLLKNKLIKPDDIIIDAKSGFSGAGRNNSLEYLEGVKTNFKAYAVNKHRHIPEIEEKLTRLAKKEVKVDFVAHLLPLERGILETIYVKKAKSFKLKAKSLLDFYKDFYKDEPFIRIMSSDNLPQIKNVVNTNVCEIGIIDNGNMIAIISAIDNLLKGASGQAVQNMNVMCGFKETEGLI
jgi:N-acetyl-gamma-glutamyl-phosphate reductase